MKYMSITNGNTNDIMNMYPKFNEHLYFDTRHIMTIMFPKNRRSKYDVLTLRGALLHAQTNNDTSLLFGYKAVQLLINSRYGIMAEAERQIFNTEPGRYLTKLLISYRLKNYYKKEALK